MGKNPNYQPASSYGFRELRAILEEGNRIFVKTGTRIDYEIPFTSIEVHTPMGWDSQRRKQWVLPNRCGEITEVHFPEDPTEDDCMCSTEIGDVEEYAHILLTWYIGKPPGGREDFHAISNDLNDLLVYDIVAPPPARLKATKEQPLLFPA